MMNSHLSAFLSSLDYNSRLVACTITRPDCHVAVMVTLDGADYFVDVGNAHPYLEAALVTSSAVHSSDGFSWRIHQAASAHRYEMQHCIDVKTQTWVRNFDFGREGWYFEDFIPMLKLSRSDKNFGPFLKGLRLTLFPNLSMIAIRNRNLIVRSDKQTKVQLGSYKTLKQVVRRYFPMLVPALDLDQAFTTLKRNGTDFFASSKL